MAEPITTAQLRAIAGGRAPFAGKIAESFNPLAAPFGLTTPLRQAHFFAQLAHESGAFKYVREIWGPTAAQKGYEGRRDLGNTQPGDGSRYRGRGPIQITGRDNYRAFTAWIQKRYPDAPDFEAAPEKLEEFPWALTAALWYWDTRNLNRLADADDVLAITKKINGGTNGLADRKAALKRAKTVLGVTPAAKPAAAKPKPSPSAVAQVAAPLEAARVDTVVAPSRAEAKADLPFWARWITRKPKGDPADRPGLAANGSPELYDIQVALRARAYYTKMGPDGLDGPITQAAVSQARKDNRLGDGGIDEAFRAALPTMPNRLVPVEKANATLRQAAAHLPEVFGPLKWIGGGGLAAIVGGTADGTGLIGEIQTATQKANDVATSVQSGIAAVSGGVGFVVEHRAFFLFGLGVVALIYVANKALDAWIKVRTAFF